MKKTYKDFGVIQFTGVKHFYGYSDEEIDQKIAAFEKSLLEAPAERSRPLKDVVEDWWWEKEDKLSPNTVQGYKTQKNDIIEHFGKVPIAELTAKQIYDWLIQLKKQDYSQKSINNRKSVLKNVLEYAITKGEISVNPVSSVPFVQGNGKKKRKPASDTDIARIEEHKSDSLIATMYYFMEYSGCRIGEAAVLQEKDIHRDQHKAVISKDLAYNGNQPLVKDRPKTEAGEREVDLYDNVLEILPKYDDPDKFIFFPDGLPRRSRLQRLQKKFQKDIGITSTAHQLRHTYAGIMHSAEIEAKDTQARMGHANISVTQDIYTEIEKAHNEKIRNKANDYIMNERLGRNKKSCPQCGSSYTRSEDGKEFLFCPICGKKLM